MAANFNERNFTVENLGVVTLGPPDATTPSLEIRGNVRMTGVAVPTAARLPGVNLAAATQTLTAAQSGQTFVAAVDAAFTLPLAAVGAGVNFQIITGVASAGTGVTIVRAGGDTINAKTTSAGTVAITGATTITNTGATDVVWDRMHLVSDGVATWYAIGQSGVWA